MKKVAVITGGSSGIGLEAAKQLLSMGYRVYTVSRREFSLDGAFHIRADLCFEHEAERVIGEVLKSEGQIDVLINSACFGLGSAIEFTSREEAEEQFRVGFFALDAMTRAVLPAMRKQGGGKIINVSSMAALAHLPFQAYYSAMKAAVNSYTLALRNEVGPYGIEVCAVMPGDIKSGFTAARHGAVLGDEAYGGRIRKALAQMESDEQNAVGPRQCGVFIAKLAEKKHLKPLCAVDAVSKAEAVLFKILPTRFANGVVGKIYGQK